MRLARYLICLFRPCVPPAQVVAVVRSATPDGPATTAVVLDWPCALDLSAYAPVLEIQIKGLTCQRCGGPYR